MVVKARWDRALRDYIVELLTSTSFHGFYHISNRNLHNTERIAWLLLIFAAIGGTIYSCLSQYHRFYARPTVMSVDRNYRSWNGTLPAGTLCYDNVVDQVKAAEFLESEFNVNRTNDEYSYFIDFLNAVLNATAGNYEQLASYGQDERFDSLDLFEVSKKIYRSLEETVNITSFDPSIKVDFHPVITEKGMCYTFNSPMSELLRNRIGKTRKKGKKFKKALSCQYGKLQCFLRLDIYDSRCQIEVHSPYEFSGIASEVISLDRSDEVLASYKIVETVASDTLRDLTPQQRKCLFSDEPVTGIPVYTKTLCYMKCRAEMAMDMCHCIPHFYPFLNGPSCTPSGYECLLDFKWPIWTPHLCNCPSTCVEHIYSIHKITQRSWSAGANISLSTKATFRWDVIPPRVRIRREVVFSFEDLLVSFGGAAALFLGFSFWSLIQVGFVTLKHISLGCYKILKNIKIRQVHV